VKILAPAAPGMPFDVRLIAETALRRPGLRTVPVRDLATRLRVPVSRAVAAVASIVDVASRVGREGAAVVQALRPAPALEPVIDVSRSIDAHLAALASRVGPVSYTASPVSASARNVAGYDAGAVSTPDLYWESPNVNIYVTDPYGSELPKSAGYPYLKIRPVDSIWPSKIAEIATGNGSNYTELGPINPHLTDPPGSNHWKNLEAGDEINLPESWASKLAARGYDIRRDGAPAPAPIPDIVPEPEPSYPSGPGPSQVLPVRYNQPTQRDGGGSMVPLLLLGGAGVAAYLLLGKNKRGGK
jgi:hypothetical protein